jgi:transcriptional regulator with XRE-family HTH domain
MDIEDSNKSVLKKVGERLKNYRLHLNITIEAVAEHINVSAKTIMKVEHGENYSMNILIKLLRAYNLLHVLDDFIPDHTVSPKQLFEMKGKKRQRASSKRS